MNGDKCTECQSVVYVSVARRRVVEHIMPGIMKAARGKCWKCLQAWLFDKLDTKHAADCGCERT
jgi:hypothetical protein